MTVPPRRSPFSVESDNGGPLYDSVEQYARQSSAFFKELTTMPLLPGSSSSAIGSASTVSGVATTITLGNLAEAVQHLSQRVGRLESLVQALDTTRRSQEASLAGKVGRIKEEAILEASVAPLKQSIAYHERLLMDVAVAIEDLNKASRKQVETNKELLEKLISSSQVGRRGDISTQMPRFQESEGGVVDIQQSMKRMSSLSDALQSQKQALTARLANVEPHVTRRRLDEQPPLTSAGALIEGATTDTTTDTTGEGGATTVAMDNLSNLGDNQHGVSNSMFHHHTATTIQPLDLSRTYQADVSGISLGSVSNTQQGPRGGSWKPARKGGHGQPLVEQVKSVIHPHQRNSMALSTPGPLQATTTTDTGSSPMGTATTVQLTSTSPSVDDSTAEAAGRLRQGLREV